MRSVSIIRRPASFGALFDDLLAAFAVAVFEMAALAEDQRALVVGEHGDGAAVVLLDGGFVEAEMAQHAAEGARRDSPR